MNYRVPGLAMQQSLRWLEYFLDDEHRDVHIIDYCCFIQAGMESIRTDGQMPSRLRLPANHGNRNCLN
jgi:agmatine/peptidylarginine deiminase